MRSKLFPLLSFRTHIAVVFGGLVIVLAGALTFALGKMLTAQIQRDQGGALNVVANNASKMLADGLFDRSREVQVLTESAAVWARGLDSAEVAQNLARSQAMRPNSLWIGVADAEGVVRSATGGLLLGQNVKARPWFAAGIQRNFVGDVHEAKLLASLLPRPNPNKPPRFVDFSAPIRVGSKVVGVLGIHGSWDWARDVVESLHPANAKALRMEVFIFDRSGAVIHAPDGKTSELAAAGMRLPLDTSPSSGNDNHAQPASVIQWQDGKDYLTASTKLKALSVASDLGWTIVVREPVEIAFAESRTAMVQAMGIGLLAAGFASLLAWFAAGRISGHLSAIATAAHDVESGRPGASIPLLESSSEVLSLATALNRMTRRLITLNEQMEDKVKLRTQELEAANRELDRQSRSDHLTGVLNRRGFEAQLKIALSSARRRNSPISVIMVDLDHFKMVNETHGHDAGDQVIRHLSDTLRQRVRDSDIVARMGGEEFVVMLPDTDAKGAQILAEELVKVVASRQAPVAGKVTISAGVSELNMKLEDLAEMLKGADEALYVAKRSGRNQAILHDASALASMA
ncbi:diguanylate cyclase [Aquabacterium sp.]|uniref:sensor domain-containing diguanylate cyclase n=1 Tax=Aquabacterium sp. TaxID=1872578 RepID=UPI0019A5B909|nr:diguanylate cyclase [Aquabacterium sp.]MBC7699397.1 diguanylate cyclase [Aquabacterium sp.]